MPAAKWTQCLINALTGQVPFQLRARPSARLAVNLAVGFESKVGERQILIEQGYSVEEEKRILDVLARGLSREFPNPERVGCPDSSILRGIASHKLPLAQAAPWFDHLSACSPCFQDFNKFRREAAGQRRRIQVWLAAAAVLLFAFGGLLWVRSRPSGQTAAVVVLDLRGRATVRGESTPETSQPSLRGSS